MKKMNLQQKIEKMIPHDKALHYLVCNVIAFVIIALSYPFIAWCAIPLAFAVCNVLIFGKEWKDKRTTGFNWVDILFGELGALTMCSLASILIGI